MTRNAEAQTLAERLLGEAHEFVRSGWCKGADAVDECGRPIEPASAFARRWSALGALERAWRRSPEPAEDARAAFLAARATLAGAAGEPLDHWNDFEGRRQEEVLDALARAARTVSATEPPLEDVDDVPPGRAERVAEVEASPPLRQTLRGQ